MRKALFGSVMLGIAAAFSFASLGDLPARVAIHWNLSFEADGFASRSQAAVMLPLLLLAWIPIGFLLPKIDPRRGNVDLHARTYWIMWNSIAGLFAIIQVLLIGTALGWDLDPARWIPIVMGGGLIVLGNFSPRLRSNWFVGVRTPWTLSSDEVWRRTHRVAGYALVAAGVILVLVGLLGEGILQLPLVIVALILAVVVPVVVSYAIRERPAA